MIVNEMSQDEESNNHHHQIGIDLNEMSGERGEQEEPLLAEQVDHSLDVDGRQSSVYRKNAISGLSALTVQVCCCLLSFSKEERID